MNTARIFLVGACLLAAVLPVAVRAWFPAPSATAAVRSASVEWPTHFRGRPLTQQPLTALEARFLSNFPGAIARFFDGTNTLIVRRVTQPTRRLHPASDCFRAAGYSVRGASAMADAAGNHWHCFVATQGVRSWRVCERIHNDDKAAAWTDVSAWYWDALFSSGPWWAITAVTPLQTQGGV